MPQPTERKPEQGPSDPPAGVHGSEPPAAGVSSEKPSPREESAPSAPLPLRTDALPDANSALGPRERATLTELARLDPRIASLFLYGHELVARIRTDPDAVYLLAHAGRELSRGVVSALLGDEVPAPPPESEELAETESNRRTIGAVLRQPPQHPSVTAWFRLNEKFVASCHLNVNVPRRPASMVAEAFVEFSALLYGRVAPYFDTAAELDELLAVAEPTREDLRRVEALLTRVQQRRYFYSRLDHPRWVVLLAERGHFANPPERILHADGSWQMQAWPAGEYLARMAPRVPDQVVEQLLLVPSTLVNPAVWSIVVDAAMALPIVQAGRLASRIAKALETTVPFFLAHKVLDLLKRLADERAGAAWKLSEALLWGRSLEGAEPPADGATASWDDSERHASAAFARVSPHELRRFCTEALPALVRLDAAKALKLMAGRLDFVLHFVRTRLPVEASDDPSSRRWCRSVVDSEDEDVRAMLASATALIATELAATGPAGAQSAWAQLEARSGDIFERIKLVLLARAGEHFPQELDAAIGGEVLLDPPFGASEVAALLRARFADASPTARALFRYRLERGPSAEEVRSSIAWRRHFSAPADAAETTQAASGPNVSSNEQAAQPPEPPLTKTDIEQEVRRWQALRLRWFHDRLPDELRDLADKAGVQAEVPTAEQQALDEGDFYSGGVASWDGPRAPKSEDELGAMPPPSIVAFISEWRPEDPGRSEFSYRGLEAALTAYAAAHPGPATEVLSSATTDSVRPGYLSALLAGLRAAAIEGRDVPWHSALVAAAHVVRAADRSRGHASEPASADADLPVQMPDPGAWANAVRAVASFVQAGCVSHRPSSDHSSQLWEVVEALVRSPAVKADESTVLGTVGFERALFSAINTASGETARALVEAGLWEYRSRQAQKGPATTEVRHVPEVEAQIAPLLSVLLTHENEARRAVDSMLGRLTPHVMLVAPAWFAAAQDQLFRGGAEDPLAHPAWGAYLLQARVYDDCFRKLRPWYAHAATVIPDAPEELHGSGGRARPRDEWSITRALASHVMSAVLRGLAAIGDQDSLVETTFTRVPASERARVYWEVYRGWSDAPKAPPASSVNHMLHFWAWRLDVLEAAAPSPARDIEAQGLLWLLKTPHLTPAEVIRLGRRTLRLGLPPQHTNAWSRLRSLSEADPAGTFDLAELLVVHEFAGPHGYLPFNEVAPILQAALACADARVRARAERLVHRIGEEAGQPEYGRLLRPVGTPEVGA